MWPVVAVDELSGRTKWMLHENLFVQLCLDI